MLTLNEKNNLTFAHRVLPSGQIIWALWHKPNEKSDISDAQVRISPNVQVLRAMLSGPKITDYDDLAIQHIFKQLSLEQLEKLYDTSRDLRARVLVNLNTSKREFINMRIEHTIRKYNERGWIQWVEDNKDKLKKDIKEHVELSTIVQCQLSLQNTDINIYSTKCLSPRETKCPYPTNFAFMPTCQLQIDDQKFEVVPNYSNVFAKIIESDDELKWGKKLERTICFHQLLLLLAINNICIFPKSNKVWNTMKEHTITEAEIAAQRFRSESKTARLRSEVKRLRQEAKISEEQAEAVRLQEQAEVQRFRQETATKRLQKKNEVEAERLLYEAKIARLRSESKRLRQKANRLQEEDGAGPEAPYAEAPNNPPDKISTLFFLDDFDVRTEADTSTSNLLMVGTTISEAIPENNSLAFFILDSSWILSMEFLCASKFDQHTNSKLQAAKNITNNLFDEYELRIMGNWDDYQDWTIKTSAQQKKEIILQLNTEEKLVTEFSKLKFFKCGWNWNHEKAAVASKAAEAAAKVTHIYFDAMRTIMKMTAENSDTSEILTPEYFTIIHQTYKKVLAVLN